MTLEKPTLAELAAEAEEYAAALMLEAERINGAAFFEAEAVSVPEQLHADRSSPPMNRDVLESTTKRPQPLG